MAIVVAVTLPLAILLWTEPDMEEADEGAIDSKSGHLQKKLATKILYRADLRNVSSR
jgi:hypothetical protein